MANQQGWSQQTPAVKAMLSSAMRGLARTVTGAARKRRKKTARASGAKRSARTSRVRKVAKTAARLVKGSAAAKRYMAKIRKLRK